MPELPFVQAMALAALVAIAAVVLAMALGRWAGVKAGQLLLRASLAGVLTAFAACLVWGAQSGDLGRFNVRVGAEAWLEMGLFFAIVYGTGYRFVSAYLADKRQGLMKEAADA